MKKCERFILINNDNNEEEEYNVLIDSKYKKNIKEFDRIIRELAPKEDIIDFIESNFTNLYGETTIIYCNKMGV